MLRLLMGAFLALAPVTPVPVPDQDWVFKAINVEKAWEVTKGEGVTIAVIDSGVDGTVPALKGTVTDGLQLADPGDQTHGTAVASVIAGQLGIAPAAKILSIRLLSGDPDSDLGLRSRSDNPLSRAIRYAVDHGARVINMSIGGYGSVGTERDAIGYALGRGVVLVAAVGNDRQYKLIRQQGWSYWSFPAGYSGVIGVGAVDKSGASTISSDNLSVMVAAPGDAVPTAVPGGTYRLAKGSSVASGLVSGVVALIRAKYPSLPPELVRLALTSTTHDRPSRGYDDKVGFGTVDAFAALKKAGELASYQLTVGDPDGRHFGEGPLPPAPLPPGPSMLKLSVFILGAGLGAAALTGAIMILRRPV